MSAAIPNRSDRHPTPQEVYAFDEYLKGTPAMFTMAEASRSVIASESDKPFFYMATSDPHREG